MDSFWIIDPLCGESAFSSMEMYEFHLKFHRNFFLRFELTNSSIGSVKGLVPTRWQAIIWTNDGYFIYTYMRHSASVS